MPRFWFATALWGCNVVQTVGLKTAPVGSHALTSATNVSTEGRQSPSSTVDVEYANGKTYRVPVRQCGFNAPLLAECCANLYTDFPYCGCWEKTHSFRYPTLIQATIYQHDSNCLLALSGQLGGDEKWKNDRVSYVVDHDPVVSERLCNAQTVRGWAVAAKTFFSHKNWVGIAEALASKQCSGGVSVVSTSLGAAMAEILAGCANHGLLSELQGDAPAFQVDQLFTFGAPPTSTESITNGRSSDGCFPGQRIFRASNHTAFGATDMVPYSTRANGFLHSRQDAIQLIELSDGTVSAKVHRCGASGTVGEPNWNTVSPYLQKMWGESGALRFVSDVLGHIDKTHRIAAYSDCLTRVPTDQLIAAETRTAGQVKSMKAIARGSAPKVPTEDKDDPESMPGFRRVNPLSANDTGTENPLSASETGLALGGKLLASVISHAVAAAFQDGYVA